MDAANSNWNVKVQVSVSSNPYSLSFLDKILFITTERIEEKESTKVVLLTTESTVVSYDLVKDLSSNQEGID
ncbi:hypothetical protein C5167_039876 [Papaver somniferum]|uniref:Uncharacterized protein n=1 Tax=Papaver somniferum TaxID=3469 RepID=A0A4Y7IGU1_PAPSO|nr:hypothetical protein C5167_039876 [Papaver somniferum]